MEKVQDTISTLKKIKEIGENLLDKLETGDTTVQDFSATVQGISKLIDKIGSIVKADIYEGYREFFDSFKVFVVSCKDYNFLMKNVDNMASSLGLFVECLNAIVEEYQELVSSANARDTLIISFLEELQLDKAIGEERLLYIKPTREVEHWIHGNCTKLIYNSTALNMNLVTFKSDLQDMNMVDNGSYDYFICSQMPDYVKDYKKAVAELYRILTQDGIGIFLIPTDGDMTLFDESEFKVHLIDKAYFVDRVFGEGTVMNTWNVCILTKSVGGLEEIINRKKQSRAGWETPKPLVSVILPSYNHEKYVSQAIESVLNQTYSNIELLIADDGSTDKTQEIILKYKEKIDQLYLFDKNKGGGLGKYLAQRANGKYVAMMHSDDVWAPNKIEMQVEFMETHPEYGACFTGAVCISDNEKMMEYSLFDQINMTKEQWICYMYKNGNCLAHPSILAKTETYLDLLRRTSASRFRQLPDFWMWLNLLCENEIHVIEKNLLYFRIHEDGENKNTSAQTTENKMRHLVEEAYIWYRLFSNMETGLFKQVFGRYMIDKEASSDEEIMCEKMFILLAPRLHYVKQAGIFYMYDICENPKVMTLLEEKYNWTKADMARISGELLS